MQFEFSDAEVAECHLKAGMLVLRFAAARVQAGPDSEPQWLAVRCVGSGVVAQDVDGGEVDGADWIGRLEAGCVRQGDQRLRQLVLPWHSAAPVRLELEWARGGTLQLDCQTLALAPLQGGRAVAAYQC